MDRYEYIKNTAVDISNNFFGNTLQDAVKFLEGKKNRGENVMLNFNGHKLYSLLDDRDSCFKEVTGYNYDEYMKVQERNRLEYEQRRIKEQLEALDKIPGRIEKGLQYIYPQKEIEWRKTVMNSTSKGLYMGIDIDSTIDIMEILKNDKDGNSFEEANKLLDSQDHSGTSYWVVLSEIAMFSKVGPAFYKHILEKDGREISEKLLNQLKQIETKNAAYEAELEAPEKE